MMSPIGDAIAGNMPVRRVVIALESSCENLRALERAAEIAVRTNAALHAVFIEDIQLLNAASLPFTRQVSVLSAPGGGFDPRDVEIALTAMAERARRCLKDLAERMGVPWSFEIVRGDRLSALAATEDTDVVVLETVTRPFARHLRLPADWGEIAISSQRVCMLLSSSDVARSGIVVIHDGSAAADRAVLAAMALDGHGTGGLTIAALAGAAVTEADLIDRFGKSVPRPMIRSIADATPGGLSRFIDRSTCALIVLPAPLVAAHLAEMRAFLATPSCGVMLVI